MYKVIDIEKWQRKSQYEWFSSFANPCYGIDCKIDVTKIVEYSKKTNTSFFINFLFIVMISLNSIEEMRIRFVNGEVRVYDDINPTYTVMTNSGFFENAGNKMSYDYNTFYKLAHEEIEKRKNQIVKDEGYNDDSYNVYYITCLPWLDYEGMTHPLPTNNPESSSVPRICWGKYHLEDEKFVLMFNITVSHAMIDGYPLSKAFNKLKENCNKIEEIFK